MINYNRVRIIKNAIYTFLALLFFLPFVLTAIVFFNIMGRLGHASETLGRLESMISQSYGENQPDGAPPLTDMQGQGFTPGSSPASSSPQSSEAQSSLSSPGASSAVISSSSPASDAQSGPGEGSDIVDNDSSGDEGEEGSAPETEDQASSQAVSNGSEAPSTWNPDSGR